MSKLFVDKDLIVIQQFSRRAVYTAPTAAEIARVLSLTDAGACVLYTYYRCGNFMNSNEIEDSVVSDALRISQKSIGNYRRKLQKAGLLLIERMSVENKSLVRVFLGEDAVALHIAGLPAQCTNSKALLQIKKKLNLRTTRELIDNIDGVVREYEENPEYQR